MTSGEHQTMQEERGGDGKRFIAFRYKARGGEGLGEGADSLTRYNQIKTHP